jgi:hypothetical protein
MTNGEDNKNNLDQFTGSLMTNTTQQINKLKDKIWSIVYYCIVLYGAILAALRYIKYDKELLAVFCIIFLFTVCIIGFKLINKFNKSIQEHREYITKIYKQHEKECKAIGVNIDHTKVDDSFINTVFKLTILIACGVSLFITLDEINFFRRVLSVKVDAPCCIDTLKTGDTRRTEP